MTAKMPKRIYRLISALTGCVIIECVALIQVFSAGSDYPLLPTLKLESLFGKKKAPGKWGLDIGICKKANFSRPSSSG